MVSLDSFANIMHSVPGLIALFAIMLAPLFVARRLKGEASWQKYRSFSLFIGIAAVVAFVAFFFAINPEAPSPFLGVFQRLFFGIVFLWIVVMAVRLLRLSLRPGAEGVPAGLWGPPSLRRGTHPQGSLRGPRTLIRVLSPALSLPPGEETDLDG